MALSFVSETGYPNYIALSTDIEDNGTIIGAGRVGNIIFLTDTSEYKLILPNLKLIPFALTNGTSGVAPNYTSSEIGNVDDTTVALTLSENVVSNDYSLGFTIKVDGVTGIVSSATRQSTHSIIYFVLASAVTHGQAVTIEYDSTSGGIISETGSVYMETFSAQSVTNNI